ncbi:MAG: acetyl-CoA carboxylase biotin carboxyl carrier protein [Chlorobi bacterium]|nr:acetyl-CoA carboxylase biotin carboxyl carrier protein [Chlorobiota bacterium]
MDFNEIHSIIKKLVKSGAAEVSFETKDLKITVKNHPKFPESTIATPVYGNQNISVEKKSSDKNNGENNASNAPVDNNLLTIKSPMVGIFYRKPAPDKPPYVNVGDNIKKGTVICIIEAMKLFNEIESEIQGKIVKTLVDDGTAIEYDQPLFIVDPN